MSITAASRTACITESEKEVCARNALFDALHFKNAYTLIVMQFIQFHVDTLPPAYWTLNFGSPKPSTEQIIEQLVLNDRTFLNADEMPEKELAFHRSHVDFILPAGASSYALCVSFEQNQPYAISIVP